MNETEINVEVGDQFTLTALVLPDDATNKVVAWESSNEEVATVDEEGNVTVVGAGTCDIIATTTEGSNLSAVCHLTSLTSGISGVSVNENTVFDIYSVSGLLLRRNASYDDFNQLECGCYILKTAIGTIKLIKN